MISFWVTLDRKERGLKNGLVINFQQNEAIMSIN